MTVGIVLSGGGAHGDFQLGALRAIYDRGIRPAVLCGTSVGSIAATKLAENPTSDTPLSQLESIWFQLQQDSDMWNEDTTFASINSRVKDMMHMSWEHAVLDVMSFGSVALSPVWLSDAIRYGIDVGLLIDAANKISNGTMKSLFNLNPILSKLRNSQIGINGDKVANSSAKLRLAVVSLESGKTRYITEKSQFLDNNAVVDLVTAVMASCAIPGFFPPQKLDTDNCVDGGIRDAIPIQAALDAGADFVYAVVCSKAGVDPSPRSFDTATILDIATRAVVEIMPEQIQHAETNPAGRGWGPNVMIIQPDVDVHDIMTIDPGLIRIAYGYGYMRASEIIDFSQSKDVWVLLKLTILMSLSKQITQTRMAIWNLEYQCAGERTRKTRVTSPQLVPVPDPDSFRALRQQKINLMHLVEQRMQVYGSNPRIKVDSTSLAFGNTPICAPRTLNITVHNADFPGVPPDVQTWWLEFEKHPWINPAAPNPWAEFISRAGTVPAVTPPQTSIRMPPLVLGTPTTSDPRFTATLVAGTIPPGGTGTIAVTFTPGTTGHANATLSVPSNDTKTPILEISLTGDGIVQPPTISVSPLIENFGILIPGKTANRSLVINNTGCAPLIISAMNSSIPQFNVLSPTVPIHIAANSRTIVTLQFVPDEIGNYSGKLTILSNDTTHPSIDVRLSGKATGRRGGDIP